MKKIAGPGRFSLGAERRSKNERSFIIRIVIVHDMLKFASTIHYVGSIISVIHMNYIRGVILLLVIFQRSLILRF